MAVWVLCRAPCLRSPQDGCACVPCGVDGPQTSLSRSGGGQYVAGSPKELHPVSARLFDVRHRFPLGLPPRRRFPRVSRGLWRIRFPLSACFPGLSRRTERSWPCYQRHLSCTQPPQRRTRARLGLIRLVFRSPPLHADHQPTGHRACSYCGLRNKHGAGWRLPGAVWQRARPRAPNGLL